MECYGLRGEATHTHSIIFAIIWLFQIISYLLTRAKGRKRGGGGKKLGLYDSAINIRIISYLLTKKRKEMEGKGKHFFALIV
jgi:hypothetical protein